MINKRGGNQSVNNEGFKVVKTSAQKKRNAKAKKKLQTQNNSKPNVKTNYKHNPNNFPNLPKPASRASTKPKSASRASTKPKSASRASTNNSNIVFGNFNKKKEATYASNNWSAITPNTSNNWGATTPNTSNNWDATIPNAWKTSPERKSKSKTSNSALTNSKPAKPKPKTKPKPAKPKPKAKTKAKTKAPPKPAFYGLTQPQFKKELEKVGFKYKEVPNSEYSNKTNLVFVGNKGYLLFSPSNNNKVKHLEKNNKNNPYKIAINDYKKSVNKKTERKYSTKGRFFFNFKKKI